MKPSCLLELVCRGVKILGHAVLQSFLSVHLLQGPRPVGFCFQCIQTQLEHSFQSLILVWNWYTKGKPKGVTEIHLVFQNLCAEEIRFQVTQCAGWYKNLLTAFCGFSPLWRHLCTVGRQLFSNQIFVERKMAACKYQVQIVPVLKFPQIDREDLMKLCGVKLL